MYPQILLWIHCTWNIKSSKVTKSQNTKNDKKLKSWKASNQRIRSWSAVRGQTTRFLLLVDISSMENPRSGPLYIAYHMRCNAIIMLHDSITVIIVTFHLFWWHLFQKTSPYPTQEPILKVRWYYLLHQLAGCQILKDFKKWKLRIQRTKLVWN